MDKNKMYQEKQLQMLDKIEEQWNKKIDDEIKDEEEIETIIDTITAGLYLNQRTSVQLNSKDYIIACKIKELPQKVMVKNNPTTITVKQVILVITDKLKYEMFPNNYTPAIVRSDYDRDYDIKANIRAAVNGWVRHITGTIKPEMLE